ncbi:ectonucleoside triphosphate diphosphohydrolase 2 isoform X3 [Ixodes scapularis]|uniref:ectonucleoside triphosphate diphosphohydrolase 2 isoform X3 n=1 Tax=Ixodes scapularis TaxID=6945 RepID=UPI001AD70118|nr:ectonucleoside triphosphate diphosphohydrolase 2 isoform X3 [Ixodes scapularis]
MEVHLQCVARPDLAPMTVRTHAGATADSLLGAFWHECGIAYDPALALYTRSNRPLRPGASLNALGVRSGDTLYLRRQRAPLLFLANWGLLAVVCGVVALLGLLLASMAYGLTGGRVPFVHGVVVDAGSSHTEATLYRWQGAKYLGTGRAVQVDHAESDGGISTMEPRRTAEDLARAVSGLLGGIRAPVYLGATAGMRVLNLTQPAQADAILMAAECALKPYGLRRAVILSGHDEGVFAWLSTNYLVEVIPQDSGHTEDTFGALDLGGASTQVAFPVSSDASSEDITELTLYGRKYRVFAVSYLCYGVNEIRRRFLAHIIAQQVSLVTGFSSSLVVGPFILQEYRDTIVSPCHNSGYTFNLTAKDIFESYCTITPQTESWLQQHPDAVFTFVGNGSANECHSAVADLMNPATCKKSYSTCLEPPKVPVPTGQKYMAFSAFYYTLKALNATGMPLDTFLNNSNLMCSATWEEAQTLVTPARFVANYCFQSMFVRDLLLDKYGFSDATWSGINFIKKAKGYDLGWSLGFMINATNAIPAAQPSAPTVGFHLFVLLLCLFVGLLMLAAAFLVLARKQSRAKLHPPM